MNTPFNSQKLVDDIIFENRNKAYGAYALRQSENTNVTKSLLMTAAFFLSIFFIAFAYVNKADKIEIPQSNIIPDINSGVEVNVTPPEKPKDLPKDKSDSAPKTESGQVTATDEKNDNNLSTNDKQNISTNPNPDGKGVDTTDREDPGLPKEVVKEDPDKLEKFPDVLPLFDGNMQQFIASNLKYPGIAISEGAQGVIYVAFVVEKDGSLSNFEVLKGKIGYGCEQEAIRVLKSMPKWKVGYKNNKAIRYPCVLPIKFSLK